MPQKNTRRKLFLTRFFTNIVENMVLMSSQLFNMYLYTLLFKHHVYCYLVLTSQNSQIHRSFPIFPNIFPLYFLEIQRTKDVCSNVLYQHLAYGSMLYPFNWTLKFSGILKALIVGLNAEKVRSVIAQLGSTWTMEGFTELQINKKNALLKRLKFCYAGGDSHFNIRLL